MAGQSNNDDGMISGINITPMVDVVLVLLIIFMVTASYIVTPSIPVKLPTASTGEVLPTKTISIVMTKENKYFVEGKEIAIANLKAYLAEKQKENKKIQIVIAADKKAYYGNVIKVVDMIRLLGISDYAFNIEEE